MACKIKFAVALSRSLLGAKTEDGSYTVFDGESLIATNYGQDAAHPLYSDDSIDVTSTGVKVTRTFKYVIPTDLQFAADIMAHVPHKVTGRTGAGGEGRFNLKILKNAVQQGSTVNGPISATFFDADGGAATAASRSVILRAELPETTFNAGDTLEFSVEIEVTTTGTGSSSFRTFHDPSGGTGSLNGRCMFEVNI